MNPYPQKPSDTLNPNLVDWVIFDIGNLLFRIDHTHAWEQTIRHTTLPLDEAMRRFQSYGEVVDALIGKIDDETFFKSFADLIDFTAPADLLASFWNPVYQPFPDRLELLEKVLKSFNTGLLSNITSFHSRYLEQRYPLLRKIPVRIYSWETGFVKPRPEIFEAAIRLCQSPPERILFVDDHPGHTEAASELGFQTLRVSPDDSLCHAVSPWTESVLR